MNTNNTGSAANMQKLLDILYEKALSGIPKLTMPVIDLANGFTGKYKDKETACRMMLKSYIMKCSLSGFLTGLGGILLLPIALPINIITVLYMQIRMIACIAHISGLDLRSAKTKTFVYACFAGVSLNAVLKNTGIKFGVKIAQSIINKLPAKIINKINQKAGFKLLTKVGVKSAANLSKFIPGIGAVIGGALDYGETKIVADRAYKWFIDGKLSGNGDDKKDNDFIDIENYTIK